MKSRKNIILLKKTMRLVIQRVKQASVMVNGATTGAIGTGLLVFIGISRTDAEADAEYLLDKIYGLRIFPDSSGKMNLDVRERGGSLLLVSQFTLYGDCRKGRRPSFDEAAPPQQAEALYNYFVGLARQGPIQVETGIFQASMEVQIVNDGPVTIVMDSDGRKRP
jgi:D-tyrosyl-tRNA(Tyr) deacylase